MEQNLLLRLHLFSHRLLWLSLTFLMGFSLGSSTDGTKSVYYVAISAIVLGLSILTYIITKFTIKTIIKNK